MFFYLLIVNNRWPSLHLVIIKRLIFGPFPGQAKLGSKEVKQWQRLSNYCISSLSSCFPDQNNSWKHNSGLERLDLAKNCISGLIPTEKQRTIKDTEQSVCQCLYDVRYPLCCCGTERPTVVWFQRSPHPIWLIHKGLELFLWMVFTSDGETTKLIRGFVRSKAGTCCSFVCTHTKVLGYSLMTFVWQFSFILYC